MKKLPDIEEPMMWALSLFPQYWSKEQIEHWMKWAKAKYLDMISKGLSPKQSDFMGS